MKQKLPIGIQSFAKLREESFAYVDKTSYIAELMRGGQVYFLSRPRRFGKSLLLDTMHCAFSGKRELFNGLYLDTPASGWDWQKKNPVLRVDWSISPVRTPEQLTALISSMLDTWNKNWNLKPSQSISGKRFEELVQHIHRTTQSKPVILIDEYDKPILDTIENPAIALQMRDILKDFYSALKPLDEHLRFVFLTGVSKFAKTGIFSGLNNLHDITITKEYSALCGYTQEDLEKYFAEYLKDFDKEQVREWYNGYAWTGEAVYNPFDILLLFAHGVYKAHWFETGTPTFLVKTWKKQPRNPAEYDGMITGEEMIGSFDIENLSTETLLFQAGYLTIKQTETIGGIVQYILGYPNLEVRSSLNRLLAMQISGNNNLAPVHRSIVEAIEKKNGENLKNIVTSFLASIPHDWHRKNNIAEYEGYWASVIYTLFAATGYDVIPEDTTNCGRIDLTVRTETGIWIFEFKVKGIDKSGGKSPLAQLREKNYAEKYRGRAGKNGAVLPVYEIGMVFDPENRNIENWEE